MNNQYFSQDGLEKLKKEMEERTNVLRPEIAVRIREAKELGDLSENAEYSEAKEAQSLNEGRIEEIKSILENAILIDGDHRGSTVTIGSSIRVESKLGSKQYVIVGAAESNPLEGFISNESPLGSAFLGHKKGEVLTIKTPKGAVEYKITDVK